MAEAGKGDKQRPTDYEKFSRNFEAIFGNKTKITEQEFNNTDKEFNEAYNDYQKADRPHGATPQPRPHN